MQIYFLPIVDIQGIGIIITMTKAHLNAIKKELL
jgi:hypothetical protein